MFYELILDGIPNNNIKNKSANNKNFYSSLSRPSVGVDDDMKSSHDLTLPDVVFAMKGHSGLVVESHVRHALSSFNMSSLPTI